MKSDKSLKHELGSIYRSSLLPVPCWHCGSMLKEIQCNRFKYYFLQKYSTNSVGSVEFIWKKTLIGLFVWDFSILIQKNLMTLKRWQTLIRYFAFALSSCECTLNSCRDSRQKSPPILTSRTRMLTAENYFHC